MEDIASGNEELLLARMRALARRGAELRKSGDGTAVIAQADDRRPALRIAPEDFIRLIDEGWLRETGMDRFVMSKRGLSALRAMLSRPALPDASPAKTLSDDVVVEKPEASAAPQRKLPEVNVKESPLAWLMQRKDKDGNGFITREQFEAGERLRADFERGNMGPRVTASWNPAASPSGQSRSTPGIGVDLSDSAMAARQRVEAALKAVGPELSGMLIDVCCFLKGIEQAEKNGGWPQRGGKVALKLALAHLARHYGLDNGSSQHVRLRIWHADG